MWQVGEELNPTQDTPDILTIHIKETSINLTENNSHDNLKTA